MKLAPLLIAVVLSAGTVAAQTDDEPVKVILFGSVIATGVYVAHDLGYFTDGGLDVVIEHTPSSKYLVTELVESHYQIAQASWTGSSTCATTNERSRRCRLPRCFFLPALVRRSKVMNLGSPATVRISRPRSNHRIARIGKDPHDSPQRRSESL